MLVDVGAREEFRECVPRVVNAAGREIGIIAWRGELFALRNVCPHQLGPVCAGHAMPLLVGDARGDISVDEDTVVVVCPWHGWEFDARTGRAAWAGGRVALRTYPVKEEDGRVLVALEDSARLPTPAKTGQSGS